MGEKILVDKLKNKNEEAYVDLINLYGNRLLRTLYLMIGDEREAEDLVQETFIRVFKFIGQFKGKSSLYTWIYRISQNVLKDNLPLEESIPYEDLEESLDNVEETIIFKIDRQILRTELNKLAFIYRQTLTLFYFEDLSIKEISQILDEREGTIKSRLSRGRQELKKALEKGGSFNG